MGQVHDAHDSKNQGETCCQHEKQQSILNTVQQLDEEIDVLEQRKSQFEQDIKKDHDFVTQMQDTFEMERYARSQYYLKKKDETIFLIEEADSTKNNSAQ